MKIDQTSMSPYEHSSSYPHNPINPKKLREAFANDKSQPAFRQAGSDNI